MRIPSRRLVLSAAALAVLSLAGDARAQFTVPSGTSQIQEDWICVIANPSPSNDGPQMQIYMSAVSDSSLPYTWLMLNSRDSPYAGGGMQVQIWTYADALLSSAKSGTAKLNTANETITWTQSLVITQSAPYSLIYSVLNGSSTTWGTFGLGYGLNPITFGTGLVPSSNFTSYSPSVSVSKSQVGWQANNVTKLGITQVRCYDKNGKLLQSDTTWRPVNLTPQ